MANDASRSWDLRCELREKLIAYLQREHVDCLPRHRLEITTGDAGRFGHAFTAHPLGLRRTVTSA
jgi:hypothetical protein